MVSPNREIPFALVVLTPTLRRLLAWLIALSQLPHDGKSTRIAPLVILDSIVLHGGKPTHVAPFSTWDLVGLNP